MQFPAILCSRRQLNLFTEEGPCRLGPAEILRGCPEHRSLTTRPIYLERSQLTRPIYPEHRSLPTRPIYPEHSQLTRPIYPEHRSLPTRPVYPEHSQPTRPMPAWPSWDPAGLPGTQEPAN